MNGGFVPMLALKPDAALPAQGRRSSRSRGRRLRAMMPRLKRYRPVDKSKIEPPGRVNAGPQTSEIMRFFWATPPYGPSLGPAFMTN